MFQSPKNVGCWWYFQFRKMKDLFSFSFSKIEASYLCQYLDYSICIIKNFPFLTPIEYLMFCCVKYNCIRIKHKYTQKETSKSGK